MKKYLEERIEIFRKGKEEAIQKSLSFKIGHHGRDYFYQKSCRYAFALSETQKHLDYLLSHNIIQDGYDIDEHFLYEPIPLTEEWLTAFGFIKDTLSKSYYRNNVHINYNYNNGFCFNFTGRKYIKHVHQLQNLYFALTGKELKLTQNNV